MPRLATAFLMSFFLALPLMAQRRTIDSLSRVLPSIQGTTRVDVLNDLSSAHYDYDSERGLEFAQQARKLASELDYAPGLRQAITYEGFYYFSKGDFTRALEL